MKFKCKNCGACCGVVPFTAGEYEKIKERAEKLNLKFVSILQEIPFVLPNGKNTKIKKLLYFEKRQYEIIINKFGELKNLTELQIIDDKLICCGFRIDGKCEIYDDRPYICRKFGTNGNENKFLRCPHTSIILRIQWKIKALFDIIFSRGKIKN